MKYSLSRLENQAMNDSWEMEYRWQGLADWPGWGEATSPGEQRQVEWPARVPGRRQPWETPLETCRGPQGTFSWVSENVGKPLEAGQGATRKGTVSENNAAPTTRHEKLVIYRIVDEVRRKVLSKWWRMVAPDQCSSVSALLAFWSEWPFVCPVRCGTFSGIPDISSLVLVPWSPQTLPNVPRTQNHP